MEEALRLQVEVAKADVYVCNVLTSSSRTAVCQ